MGQGNRKMKNQKLGIGLAHSLNFTEREGLQLKVVRFWSHLKELNF